MTAGVASSLGTARITAGRDDVYLLPASPNPKLPPVIVFHGSNVNVGTVLGSGGLPSYGVLTRALAAAGFVVVAPSIDGFWGNSTSDARIDAALAWTRANLPVHPSWPPFLVGASMGAYAALEYAADHPVCGVVGIIPAIDGQAIRVADTLSLRAVIDSAWGVTYPGTLITGQALLLPGVAGSYASSPDSVALSITGDIDIRMKVAVDDWTPSADMCLVAKEQTGSTISYRLVLNNAGKLQLGLSAAGSVVTTATSSVTTGVADGAVKWVRATWRPSDGRTQFFTSNDGSAWSQLGTNITLAVASIFDSTSQVEIGTRRAGAQDPLAGKVYRAQIRNNILDDGTGIIFDADFTTPTVGATFPEGSSNAATVTINGVARIDKNANPAVQTTALAQVSQQLWYATDDAVSANIAAYATAVGADLRPMGATGHSDASIATATPAEIIRFIAHRMPVRIAA